jgi:hypothetical protein
VFGSLAADPAAADHTVVTSAEAFVDRDGNRDFEYAFEIDDIDVPMSTPRTSPWPTPGAAPAARRWASASRSCCSSNRPGRSRPRTWRSPSTRSAEDDYRATLGDREYERLRRALRSLDADGGDVQPRAWP